MRSSRPVSVGLPRRHHPWLGGLALLGGAFASRSAHANDASDAARRHAAGAPDARSTIVLIVDEPARSTLGERAAALVAAHVRSSRVKLQLAPRREGARGAGPAGVIATEASAKGVLWIEASQGDELVLYLFAAMDQRVFRWSIAAPQGHTSAAVEALANVAGSAAAELLEGRVVTMLPVEIADAAPAPSPPPPAPIAAAAPPGPAAASPPAPPPAPAPRRPEPRPPRTDSPDRADWLRMHLSAGYTGGTFASLASWQSAVALGASWSPAPHARIGLGYDVMVRQNVGKPPSLVDLNLDRHPIVISGGYRLGFGDRWDVDLGARATTDILVRGARSAEGTSPSSQPGGATVDAVVSLAPTVGLGFQSLHRLRLGVWAGVDIPLNRLSATTQTKIDVHLDPARFLGGIEVQLGLVRAALPHRTAAGR